MAVKIVNLKLMELEGYTTGNSNVFSPIFFYMDENEGNVWNPWVWQ